MNMKKKWCHIGKTLSVLMLCLSLAASCMAGGAAAEESPSEEPSKKFIKWMTFDVPYEALVKAKNIDIKSHDSDHPVHWVDLLAYLGAKYGGNWKKYRARDMDTLVSKLRAGQTIEQLTQNMKHYPYFHETIDAVLSNFIGDYQTEAAADESGGKTMQTRYGLKVFSPIAKGYGYSHYDDFGDSRSFGFRRRHLGNDLLGSVGTPIVAVESGVVESLGWNRYGGWRIGIRSFDSRRYYYYAHLRKGHPYAKDLHQGQTVKAGDVIGYLGMTGYSNKEDVNGMNKPHLHFGMQIIFDESQKEGNNEIWIDVYDIVNLLSPNRVKVRRDDSTKDYCRVYDYMDLQYRDRFLP